MQTPLPLLLLHNDNFLMIAPQDWMQGWCESMTYEGFRVVFVPGRSARHSANLDGLSAHGRERNNHDVGRGLTRFEDLQVLVELGD